MLSHCALGTVGFAPIDRPQDRPMLVDERHHRFRAVERQMTNPLHMRFDVRESRPSQFTSSALSQCDMKKLVRPLERAVIIASSGVRLAAKKVVHASPTLRIEGLAGAADDRHLDCFPNEPGFHHFLD